jgi:hypothetical protein
MRVKGSSQHAVVGGDRVAPAQHDEVHSAKVGVPAAKAFADQPLETIAVGGATGLLAGDGETESRRACVVAAPCEHREKGVGGPNRTFEDPRELLPVEQARGARKALSADPIDGRWTRFDQRKPAARAARRDA